MPIINLQRRLRTAGKIKIGAKVPTKNGSTRPAKLDSFRLISPDRTSIETVASVYGGEVQQWEDAPVGTGWEVITKATQLEVLVPPTEMAFSQFYESWTSAGCMRRCDSETEFLTDSPCLCDPENRQCVPTTRLNVILTAIQGIGVWRFETRGYTSGAELGGTIDILKAIQTNTNAMVPGRLLLEQRESKGTNPSTNRPETYHYAVATLDLDVSVASLAAGNRVPGVTPIQQAPSALPSVAEQLMEASEPRERPKRSNAAAPLPATGLKPKPVTESSSEVPTAALRGLFARINGNKDIDSSDEGRKQWASDVLGRTVTTFSHLTTEEIKELSDIAPTYKNPDKEEDAQRPFDV